MSFRLPFRRLRQGLFSPNPSFSSTEFANDRPSILRTLHNFLFYKPELFVGLALGGLSAAAVFLFHSQADGSFRRLITGVDRIVLENGHLMVIRREGSTPPPSPAPSPPPPGGGDKVVDINLQGISDALSEMPLGENLDHVVLPLPGLSFVFWTLLTAGTAGFAYAKARMDLSYRQFVRRVGFSLSMFDGRRLQLRTVAEKGLSDLMMGNMVATKVVLDAAKRTTEKEPFLNLLPNENYVVMKAIFNELSPICATGFFQIDRGMEVERAWYGIGLSFERTAVFRKLRVVIASEELLQRLGSYPADFQPELEDDAQIKRWRTLLIMSRIFREKGFNNPQSCLWRIEMAFPKERPLGHSLLGPPPGQEGGEREDGKEDKEGSEGKGEERS